MRVFLKIVFVLLAAAAVTAFAGRAATGRFPSVRTLAIGTVGGAVGILLADLLIGW